MDASTKRMVFGAAQLAFVACAAVAVYSFVTVAKEGEHRRACTAECIVRPDYAGADRLAPDFALKDLKGTEVKLSSYRGKVVVLNFWTRTCGPCLKEMPDLAELAEVLAPKKDVAMIAVSIDDEPSEVDATLKGILRGPVPFTVLLDPDGDNAVMKKFGTHLFPETWIIDQSGVVRARFDGARPWTDAAVVEMIDQIRGGGYCPLKVDKKTDRESEQAERVCGPLVGG
jgi:peroxiredoxin